MAGSVQTSVRPLCWSVAMQAVVGPDGAVITSSDGHNRFPICRDCSGGDKGREGRKTMLLRQTELQNPLRLIGKAIH